MIHEGSGTRTRTHCGVLFPDWRSFDSDGINVLASVAARASASATDFLMTEPLSVEIFAPGSTRSGSRVRDEVVRDSSGGRWESPECRLWQSVTALSFFVSQHRRIEDGSPAYSREDCHPRRCCDREIRAIALDVFQEPRSALKSCVHVGDQVAEVARARTASRRDGL